ncbi:MAG: sigma-54-dependent Fis family transcriptional regulator [Deltaproteobacteria bacterium]|nr:MAG: sigma-54-dependent Fis family transcriptional regulator [Deltaproteobacteria bacterium]
MPASSDAETCAVERDFYRRLLDLGGQSEIEPLLDQALALIAEVTQASTAYLELHDDELAPRFWRGHGCSADDVASIRESISGGIIARAIADGRTVETPSALGDPRFESMTSVQTHEIEAVLCAPVGVPPIGVIYLQGRTGGDSFTAVDRERLELFARQLAPIADRLVALGPGRERIDHTRAIRQRFRCDELVGRSEALARVLTEASHVAPLEISVLITGPTGTGKSVLARAIAANSKRAQQPFVAINCAAIPEALIESELFGAERGAHSTATHRMSGKIAAAAGGTLFLDEVAELSSGAQSKLLQLLQERQYYPLGASTPVAADVRIISATNEDLKARVTRRQFREDLYYRLHVLPIEMPGIAERRDDIPELVEHFCSAACQRHGLRLLRIARRTLQACRDAAWPGHLRELANAIEAGVVRAQIDDSETLLEHHVFPRASKTADDLMTLHEATRQFRRRYVRDALEQHDWNVTETARLLDLARGHLYSLIHDFGLRRDDER